MNNLLIIINSSLLGGLLFTLVRCIKYNFFNKRVKLVKIFINEGTIIGGLLGLSELYYFNYYF